MNQRSFRTSIWPSISSSEHTQLGACNVYLSELALKEMCAYTPKNPRENCLHQQYIKKPREEKNCKNSAIFDHFQTLWNLNPVIRPVVLHTWLCQTHTHSHILRQWFCVCSGDSQPTKAKTTIHAELWMTSSILLWYIPCFLLIVSQRVLKKPTPHTPNHTF